MSRSSGKGNWAWGGSVWISSSRTVGTQSLGVRSLALFRKGEEMGDLLSRVIAQFDTLISLLDISEEHVYNVIRGQKSVWFPQGGESALPRPYSVYREHIIHSALVLGYSYFEAFLADLVREIYSCRPAILPSKKQLQYAEILAAEGREAILQLMVDKEVVELFYKSMEDIVQHFEQKLGISWPDEHKAPAVEASYLRNCIIHNLGRADHRLAGVSNRYEVGDRIELEAADVHEYGLIARDLARRLFGQANEKHIATGRRKD